MLALKIAAQKVLVKHVWFSWFCVHYDVKIMTKESDGLKVLQDALGLIGISDPKPLKPPVTSIKTHPIQQPKWFGPLATRLLQSDPPVIATMYLLGKALGFNFKSTNPISGISPK